MTEYRRARPDDLEDVAGFTSGTFRWGDYVTEEFPHWLAESESETIVAEADGRVVGLAHVSLPKPDQAWIEGIRVHPDHRRGGVATELTTRAWRWAEERGAKVARLAIEDRNHTARTLFAGLGFRPSGAWLLLHRGVGEASPVPQGNGGRRVVTPEGLRPAHSAEAEPAFLSWTSGQLASAARGLAPTWWVWSRLEVDDLVEAAKERRLWEGRPGWAEARVSGDVFRVGWIETTEADAPAMARALVDRAADAGGTVERFEALVPDVDWLVQSFRTLSCRTFGVTVHTRPL